VVARAVRLRIRLAPGVQLVSVLGARRLDELHAEQVRTAEQRIDQRVSRALGIAADRGEDEEGFYGGGSVEFFRILDEWRADGTLAGLGWRSGRFAHRFLTVLGPLAERGRGVGGRLRPIRRVWPAVRGDSVENS
jgi:hypothetical protein